MRTIFVAAALALIATSGWAQDKPTLDPARVDAVVKAAFPNPKPEFQPRLTPDETMKLCAAHGNAPPQAMFEQIQKAEKAKIEYPADGALMGDWKVGERLAQSGYGLRFTDYPPRGVNGGNCYACHQLTKAEVSYGTLGPSLLGYGQIKKFGEAETKAAYEKIYNANAALPCSNMPRFGVNKVLTIAQIKDIVALLMSPDSPVNK
jgi:sulfur-oxidizing protein SoxX